MVIAERFFPPRSGGRCSGSKSGTPLANRVPAKISEKGFDQSKQAARLCYRKQWIRFTETRPPYPSSRTVPSFRVVFFVTASVIVLAPIFLRSTLVY